MATTVKARTARKPHLCDTCHFTPSLRGVPTIAPGHRYLRHVSFPDGEVNQSPRPVITTECVAHLAERDPDGPMLTADACATYCCSLTPCARPLNHGGDHECRDCIDRIPATTAA